MSFQDAVRSCFQKYVVISGRAPRSEYWWWVLFVILANVVMGMLDGAIFGFGAGGPSILGPVFGLATLLPSICVSGRRLHDRDMSAWWLLLMLLPIVGPLVLLFIYVLPGTHDANRFGPDPLGRDGIVGPERSPSVWDENDESFTRSSIPRSGRDRDK